jgi:hypothetical protein
LAIVDIYIPFALREKVAEGRMRARALLQEKTRLSWIVYDL